MYHQVKWTYGHYNMAANWTVFPHWFSLVVYDFLNVYIGNGNKFTDNTFRQVEYMIQQCPPFNQTANLQLRCRFNRTTGRVSDIDLFDITKISSFIMWCNTNSLVNQFDLSIIQSTCLADTTLNDISWYQLDQPNVQN